MPEKTATGPVVEVTFRDGILTLAGPFIAATAGTVEQAWARSVRGGAVSMIDGSGVMALDTSGALLIQRMAGGTAQLRGFSVEATRLLESLAGRAAGDVHNAVARAAGGRGEGRIAGALIRLADRFLHFLRGLEEVAVLGVDVVWWSVVGLFRRGQYRGGTFTDQAIHMGSSALPIVATILFLIGAISVLQSASTLRTYGASIFVIDMLAIGLARELAPLMTGIVVAGRSGSAIASEIATMKFTEELDALRTMGLNPIRFVVVPKLWAMAVGLPLLSFMGLVFGLLGGFIVAGTYMQLPLNTMVNRLLVSLLAWDIVTGLIKSLSFAVMITIIGTWRGMTFTGGADGVGRATTSSVVTSIFGMIVVDSIWGLIFYL